MNDETEYRLMLARYAAMGILMLGTYALAPFLTGDVPMPTWERDADVAESIVSRLPIVPVASGVAIWAFVRSLTRRIPRRVSVETRPQLVDYTRGQDVER